MNLAPILKKIFKFTFWLQYLCNQCFSYTTRAPNHSILFFEIDIFDFVLLYIPCRLESIFCSGSQFSPCRLQCEVNDDSLFYDRESLLMTPNIVHCVESLLRDVRVSRVLPFWVKQSPPIWNQFVKPSHAFRVRESYEKVIEKKIVSLHFN